MAGPMHEIPREVASVEDYELLAEQRVEPGIWAYVAGGSGDETTLQANREAFAKWRIVPRLFRDLSAAETKVELFGRVYEHPVLVAPMAFHRLMHPEGELATVLAAAAMEAGVVVSTQASFLLEEIAAAAQGPLWFQLYIQPDREFTLELVRRAEAAGYEALVVTADAPLGGLRNREQRSGFRMPEGVEAVNLRGMKGVPPAERIFGSELLATAPTWKDLEWLCGQTKLPVVVKGILAREDARIAVDQGVDGIAVSNHGGRTLDGVPAAIEALPEVAAEVGGAVPLFLDGGIRRGTDVFKALALGADAVMVGRPVLYGLAVAGAVGVAHVLKLLRTELEMAMALAGRPTIGEIGEEALRAVRKE